MSFFVTLNDPIACVRLYASSKQDYIFIFFPHKLCVERADSVFGKCAQMRKMFMRDTEILL